MAEIDANGDGVVDLDEFKTMMGMFLNDDLEESE